MSHISGKKLVAATVLLQLAALCAFFAALTLLFNLESVVLSPWGCVAALAAAVLSADTAVLFLLFRSRG